ncbi:hypothetical protein [Rhabdothermincola salaria]|uniref:hypothetical protein n=1 Tax=Rhabdothermincola salaria TaxID=2903142 RepID=UPI001E382769|nr:hypothetical protein [Rhabdothermincola salaria]MCD9624820.1 hypothetical protein [Rhabdothermincola salaria]
MSSLLLTALLVAVIFPYRDRRPVGTMLTWGEAMVAGTYVFFVFFWVYGVVPHLWLTWADNELGWRPDKLLFGPGEILKPQELGGWFPFTLNYLVIRDIVAVLIYVAFLAGNIWLWSVWQNRGKKAAEVPAVVESEFGRPLVRKS